MPFFDNPFLLFATASLLIQVMVLFLLLYGYWQIRKSKLSRHGYIMTMAVFLHLTMIFTIMIPAFALAVLPDFVILHFSGVTSIVSLIHVPLGVISVSIGLWLVLSWRLRGLKGCFNRKTIMKPMIIVWLVTLSMGIVLYFILYWSVLTT